MLNDNKNVIHVIIHAYVCVWGHVRVYVCDIYQINHSERIILEQDTVWYFV